MGLFKIVFKEVGFQMFLEEGQQGVIQGHTKVLCTLGKGHHGVVNRDGEVLEQAGLSGRKCSSILADVELEVVGRHPN